MSVDHLYFNWWLDDEGHPWVAHDCTDEHIDAWRLPPPWRLDGNGGLTPSFDCKRCGRHTFLTAADRRERVPNPIPSPVEPTSTEDDVEPENDAPMNLCRSCGMRTTAPGLTACSDCA